MLKGHTFSPPSASVRRPQGRLVQIGVLCAIFSFPLGASGQTISPATGVQASPAEPATAGRIDFGMPERLGRQIAPTPSSLWRAPDDLRGYTSLLKSAEPSPIDPQKRYDLVELIDIAERVNPETRVAWEAARQAALQLDWSRANTFRSLHYRRLGVKT